MSQGVTVGRLVTAHNSGPGDNFMCLTVNRAIPKLNRCGTTTTPSHREGAGDTNRKIKGGREEQRGG